MFMLKLKWAYVLILLAFALFMCVKCADAQLADLDLLQDDDRAIGISVSRTPDPTTGNDTASESAILLFPISLDKFQGGAGAYWTRSTVGADSASSLQWRVQGGPQILPWLGVQGYVEGVWKQSVDYAAFVRIGTFDLGRYHIAGGLGAVADVPTLETGIERNAAAASEDIEYKGLILGSVDVDTELFETLRVLGTVLPGKETDYVGEAQIAYSLGRINLTGIGRIGYEDGGITKRYTDSFKCRFSDGRFIQVKFRKEGK